MLLNTHRAAEDGDKSWSVERQRYRLDAQRFLAVARRMADLEWTREDWRWLSTRNARSLLTTEERRAVYEREFRDAPLLMDGKKTNMRGEDGADRNNKDRLEQLSSLTEYNPYLNKF